MYSAFTSCSAITTCKRSCTGDPALDTIRLSTCPVEARSTTRPVGDTVLQRWSARLQAEAQRGGGEVKRPLSQGGIAPQISPMLLAAEAGPKHRSDDDGAMDAEEGRQQGCGNPLRRSTSIDEASIQQHQAQEARCLAQSHQQLEHDQLTAQAEVDDACRADEEIAELDAVDELDFGPAVEGQLAEEVQSQMDEEELEQLAEVAARQALQTNLANGVWLPFGRLEPVQEVSEVASEAELSRRSKSASPMKRCQERSRRRRGGALWRRAWHRLQTKGLSIAAKETHAGKEKEHISFRLGGA